MTAVRRQEMGMASFLSKVCALAVLFREHVVGKFDSAMAGGGLWICWFLKLPRL